MAEHIDTNKMVQHYRERVLRPGDRSILLANVGNSDQSKDLKLPPNCNGFGRIHHFKRSIDPAWPLNPLPIDPAARALGRCPGDLMQAQVFQVAGCPWRCWYCYVPERLLSANPNAADWIGIDQLVHTYLESTDLPNVIDLSGGAPDLVPEWVVWMMEELVRRAIDDKVYLWSDDSLSTDYVWTALTDQQREVMSRYKNYGHVACFKGFDDQSFSFNTRASPDGFAQQLQRFARLLTLNLDLYAYVTLTASPDADVRSGIPTFMDRLQKLHPNLPLRTVPLLVMKFTPVGERLTEDRELAFAVQRKAIEVWAREIEERFPSNMRSRNIVDIPIAVTQ